MAAGLQASNRMARSPRANPMEIWGYESYHALNQEGPDDPESPFLVLALLLAVNLPVDRRIGEFKLLSFGYGVCMYEEWSMYSLLRAQFPRLQRVTPFAECSISSLSTSLRRCRRLDRKQHWTKTLCRPL